MFILKGVNIPYKNGWKVQDVEISNGVFSEISDSIAPIDKSGGKIRSILPSRDSYLIPAMIDPHVHVREPGFEYKEDWSSCSKAALKGGVVVIIDMPNNKIPVDDLEKINIKSNIATKKSYVNYGLYIALTDNNADQIAKGIFNDYICGIKIYMAKTTGGLIVDSIDTIKKSFYQEKPVLVHTGGKEGLLKLLKAYEEVYKDENKAPALYICHISTEKEVEILASYKRKFPNIVGEVTPHHLFLNIDDYNGPPEVLPPLGNKQDQSALWDALIDGIIDLVGTDHAPHTLQEKLSDNPPSGFPGLETALPMLFNSFIDGKLPLNRLIEITSIKAADIFNINGYGKIEKGRAANCTLIVKENWTIGEDGYQTKCGWSPFDGKNLKNKVYLTIVNGNISYIDGKFYRGQIRRLCINGD